MHLLHLIYRLGTSMLPETVIASLVVLSIFSFLSFGTMIIQDDLYFSGGLAKVLLSCTGLSPNFGTPFFPIVPCHFPMILP